MRTALGVAAAGVVVLVGQWLTLPGIDRERVADLAHFSGTSPRLFPLIGSWIAWLVLARVVLALTGKSENSRARAVTLSICLGITAIHVLALAFWAESFAQTPPFFDIVAEPGLSFRLMASGAGVAGVALSWWIADRIDAAGRASGALAIALFAAVGTLTHDASTLGASIVNEGVSPWAGAAAFAVPAAMLIAALTLALTPTTWPLSLGGFVLRSGFDVVATPCALFVVASITIGESAPLWARTALVLGGTLALALALRRAPRSNDRTRWPIGIALALFVIVGAPIAGTMVSSGYLARSLEPGPLEGDASFQITLAAVDRFRDGEADAMVEVLDALGPEASVVSADAHRIVLRVSNARDVDSVLAALRPHALAMHFVAEAPAMDLPEGARPPTPHFAHAAEGPCHLLRGWAENAPCTSAIEPVELDQCRLYCLEPTPVITSDDVADAVVIRAAHSGLPEVGVVFTEEAGQRFEQMTGANVGRQLAIVLDGEITAAPVIRSAIPGGRAQIQLGAGDPEVLRADAQALVRALTSGHRITSAWTYEALVPSRPPGPHR